MKKLCIALVAMLLSVGMAYAESGRYWIVAGSATQVWSLAADNFVSVNDGAYQTWSAIPGNHAAPIKSASELYEVLSNSYPSHLDASTPVLEAGGGLTPLQSLVFRRHAGLHITYTGQSGLNGTYAVDDQWLSGLMSGALLRCGATSLASCSNPFPNGAATYTLIDLYGAPHTMTASQMAIISLAIQDYWANCVAQLQIALGGGSPTWPSSSVTVP